MLNRLSALLALVPLMTACVSSQVQTGAVIGALSGAAAGGTVGVLISDEDLLGSPATKDTGDVGVDSAEGIGTGVLLGAVFGAVVGAMAGHVNEPDVKPRKPVVLPTEEVGEDEARAGAPRAF